MNSRKYLVCCLMLLVLPLPVFMFNTKEGGSFEECSFIGLGIFSFLLIIDQILSNILEVDND